MLQKAMDDVPSDTVLMRGIAAGDHAAMRILMRRHLPRCVRLAYRITGQAAAAEDIAQEVFLRIWQHAGRWKSPEETGAAFTTWLYRVVTNVSIDYQRKRSFVPWSDQEESIADSTPNAEQWMTRQDNQQEVQKALAALPDRQRVAFVLCCFEEKTNSEAAEIMGIGVKALESLLVRARQDLRLRLKDFYQYMKGQYHA